MDFFRKSKKAEIEVPQKIEKCTQIVQCLICPCNNKAYKTVGHFNRHKELQVHKTWELPQKVKDLEISVTRLTNENDHLKRLNVILTNKIFDLENKILIK
jgi:hypothetical protein